MKYSVFSTGDFPALKINSIGLSDEAVVTRFGPGKREEYIIHYVLKGKGVYNHTPVKSGQGFLITPEVFEEYYPDPSDPWEFLWVISQDPAMESIFEYYNADPDTLIFDYQFVRQLESAKEFLAAKNNSLLHRASILKLYLEILEGHLGQKEPSEKKPNAQVYIDVALHYIRANYHTALSIKELTEILGVSQPYLFKIFKGAFGKSPKQFLSDYRISQAKTLLAETDLTVAQVAASVGYHDGLSFSQYFRLKESLSPSAYRSRSRLSSYT